MSNYYINIDVDPAELFTRQLVPTGSTGNFVHTPSLLRVTLTGNDDVTFNSKYPFSVEFKGEQPPIDQVQLSGVYSNSVPQFNGDPGYSTVAYPIDQDSRGTFHYAVAVFKDNTVFIDAACGGVSVN
jgi:hypothetical protein